MFTPSTRANISPIFLPSTGMHGFRRPGARRRGFLNGSIKKKLKFGNPDGSLHAHSCRRSQRIVLSRGMGDISFIYVVKVTRRVSCNGAFSLYLGYLVMV
jgi:hypothetical protein